MGNLFRRVLAFVLGMVFTLGAVVGSAVGGVFWAYKNLKPLAVVTEPDNGLNDLRDQSIEDLLRLLTNALENPDDFTFDRLQGEYGLDLEKILGGMGIENIDTESENWKALLSVSLFNAKDGIEPLLDSIKVRALYNFLPSLLDKELDSILSREAQEKLGDYSIMELLKSDETTGELGLFKALKTLKLGALLPEYFISVYDPVAHEYTYILNENSEKAQSLPVLEVFGNVELRLIANMLNDGDIMKELMNGSLSSITEMPIEDILNDILATVSPELADQLGGYFKVLNGATLSDLFVPNSEGGYDFYYMGVLTELQLGFLLGLTDEDGDKVWVDKNGEPAPELMQVVANMDLGAIFESENPIQMIVDLIGDVNVGMILDMLGIKEGQIAVLDALRGLEIGKILAGQEGDFDVQKLIKALIANLNESFGDTTLGQLIGMESTGNALVDGLLELRIADLILEEYTLESIIEAFRNAIGDVSVGDMLGYEKDDNGAWICDNEIIALLLDFSFNNIFDAVESDYSVDAIVSALLPETTIGDLLSAILGFEYDETTGVYYKEVDGVRKDLTPALSEALKIKIADLVDYIVDEDSPVDIYDELLPVRVGDVVDLVLIYLGKEVEEFQKVAGDYVWNEEPTSGTTDLLNSSILLIAKDLFSGSNKILDTDCDVYIDIINDALNYVISIAGLEETVSSEFIDEITDALKENINCTLRELKDADIDWVKMAIGAAFVALDHFYPEEDRPAVVNEIIKLIKEYYEEGVFDNLPDSLLNLPLADVIEDVMGIVKAALPEETELLEEVEDVLLDMFHGTVGDPQLKGNTDVYDLVMDAKDIVDLFLEEGTLKDVIDQIFVEIAEMYVNEDGSKIITKYIFEAISDFEVAKAIESLIDVAEVALPEETELLKEVEDVLLNMFHGTFGDPQLKGNTDVYDLVMNTKDIVDLFLEEGTLKDVIDQIFVEIA